MRIDIHSHFFPRVYLDYLQDAYAGDNSPAGTLARWITVECGRRVDRNPGMSDIDVRLRELDDLGVDCEVLSLGNLDVYGAGDEAPALARATNDAIAAVCRAHPDRFRALACTPLNLPEEACIEVERAVQELDMCGVMIGTNVNGVLIDSPDLRPFYAQVERLGVPLVLHPTVPVATEGLMEYGLAPMIGFVYDTALAVLRLVFSGVLERHRSLRIVVPHLGGMLHYLFARIDDAYATNHEPTRELTKAPSEYLKELYYDTVNFLSPAFRCAIELVGSKHIVLGSDYPFFQERENLRRALRVMDEVGISPDEQEDICSRNALGLLTAVKPG
jgi:aminocarboxymuconate-semialdehyde decarboxylase